MSIWPILDGVEQLKRGAGAILGIDGHKYAALLQQELEILSSPTYSYGSTIRSMAVDDNFIYVGGGSGTFNSVHKIDRATGASVGSSSPWEGFVYALKVDSDFVYAGIGANVCKIRKNDMGTIASVPGGDSQFAFTIDDQYLYTTGVNTIIKRRLSDLVSVGQSPSVGGSIMSMAVDDTYVYIGSNSFSTVKRYLKSNLSDAGDCQTNVPTYALLIDGDYVYGCGAGSKIFKLDRVTFTLVRNQTHPSVTLRCMDIEDDIMYLAGDGDVIYAVNKHTLHVERTSPTYGGDILALCVAYPYVLAGGVSAASVKWYLDGHKIRGYRRID